MSNSIYFYLRKIGRSFLLLFNLKLIKISLAEKILLNFSLKNNNVKFLQIGANDGISFDCLYNFVTKYKWSGIAVEPLTDFYQRLCINYENYPLVKPINIAIHPTEKRFDLYRVNPIFHKELPEWVRGMATFDYNNLIRQGIGNHQIILNSVPAIHLMELVDLYQLYGIDYLQIDVEGMDVEVVKMIDFNKLNPKLIRFEWKHIEEKEMILVRNLLKENGYLFKHDNDDFFAFKKGAI